MAGQGGIGAVALVAAIFAVAKLLDPPAPSGGGGPFDLGCQAAGGAPERHGNLRLCRAEPGINLALDHRNLDADLGRPDLPNVRVTGRTSAVNPTQAGPWGLQLNLELGEVAIANPQPLRPTTRATPNDLRFGEVCDLADGVYSVDPGGTEHCLCRNGLELYWEPPGVGEGPQLIAHYQGPGGTFASALGAAPGGGSAINFRPGGGPGIASETIFRLGGSAMILAPANVPRRA